MGIPVNVFKACVGEEVMWTVTIGSGPVVGLDGDWR